MYYPLFSIWGSDPDVEKEEGQPGVGVDVLEKEQEDEKGKTPWRVILYDDDIHTFNEVIGQLKKALKCNQSRAEDLTHKVHNEGKAKVFEGKFEECFKVNGVLKEIQLVTEIKG